MTTARTGPGARARDARQAGASSSSTAAMVAVHGLLVAHVSHSRRAGVTRAKRACRRHGVGHLQGQPRISIIRTTILLAQPPATRRHAACRTVVTPRCPSQHGR
jgi:hypothetical protein